VQQMNLVPIGTYEFFPQLVRLVANDRHRQSHPCSQQKLVRRNQSGVSTEFFLSFTPRSFPTGIRDGDQRERCSQKFSIIHMLVLLVQLNMAR
jgi:hypothetical protein